MFRSLLTHFSEADEIMLVDVSNRVLKLLSCYCIATVAAIAGAAEPLPSGQATIRAQAGKSEIVVTTTARLAGAIHSLTWDGQEFINSADHGRQLQSATNFDAGSALVAETFNPTEAGSMSDGAGDTSTSRLLHMIVGERRLQTTTQMAFWLRPGEKSGGQPAKNKSAISNHLLTKRVTLGWQELPHVMEYHTTFSLPIDEQHRSAVYEVVTGYMPPEFSEFLKFDASTGELQPLSDGPGEQEMPVALATKSGSHAMGVYAPRHAGMLGPGYGRFRFSEHKVVKWNCVFRDVRQDAIPAGDYSFRVFVIVGDRATVQAGLVALAAHFSSTTE